MSQELQDLQRMIAILEGRLQEKEITIKSQRNEISTVNQTVGTLNAKLEQYIGVTSAVFARGILEEFLKKHLRSYINVNTAAGIEAGYLAFLSDVNNNESVRMNLVIAHRLSRQELAENCKTAYAKLSKITHAASQAYRTLHASNMFMNVLLQELQDLQRKIAVLEGRLEEKEITIKSQRNEISAVNQTVGTLNEKLKNMDYLKYCNLARNEIRKFDKYAWAATPKFQYIQEDLDYFDDFDALQEEKRRLRLIHAFNHSNENAVRDVLNKLPQCMSIETFAELVAKGYRIISEEIHKISYSVSFGGLYCPAVTSDKRVNDALNIILEDIEFEVGRMVPRPKKRKMDEGGSTSNT